MVDSGGLENRCARKCTVGSNPTLSAMHFAYILKSIKDQKFYYGSTSNLGKRLKSHNSGKVRSTKNRRPFVLIYSESFESKTQALERERFFKSIAGYAWLKNNNIV